MLIFAMVAARAMHAEPLTRLRLTDANTSALRAGLAHRYRALGRASAQLVRTTQLAQYANVPQALTSDGHSLQVCSACCW